MLPVGGDLFRSILFLSRLSIRNGRSQGPGRVARAADFKLVRSRRIRFFLSVSFSSDSQFRLPRNLSL